MISLVVPVGLGLLEYCMIEAGPPRPAGRAAAKRAGSLESLWKFHIAPFAGTLPIMRGGGGADA
jgi:hypothetical protein